MQLCGVCVNTRATYNRFRHEITFKGYGCKFKPRLIIWLSSLCHGSCSVGCMSCTPNWKLFSLGWCNLSYNCLVPGEMEACVRSLPCHQEGLGKSFWEQPTAKLVLAIHKAAFCQPRYQPAHGKCDLRVACLCGWSLKFVKVAEEYSHDVVLFPLYTWIVICHL